MTSLQTLRQHNPVLNNLICVDLRRIVPISFQYFYKPGLSNIISFKLEHVTREVAFLFCKIQDGAHGELARH